MLTLARYLYKTIFPAESRVRVVMLGLDKSGKTYLRKMFQRQILKTNLLSEGDDNEEEDKVYIPTTGYEQVGGVYKNISWSISDLGGREKAQNGWKNYYYDAHIIVWCIDGTDPDRLEESASTFSEMVLSDTQLEMCAFCFVVTCSGSCGDAKKLAVTEKGVEKHFHVKSLAPDHDVVVLMNPSIFQLSEWLVKTKKESPKMEQRTEIVKQQELTL